MSAFDRVLQLCEVLRSETAAQPSSDAITRVLFLCENIKSGEFQTRPFDGMHAARAVRPMASPPTPAAAQLDGDETHIWFFGAAAHLRSHRQTKTSPSKRYVTSTVDEAGDLTITDKNIYFAGQKFLTKIAIKDITRLLVGDDNFELRSNASILPHIFVVDDPWLAANATNRFRKF